MPDLVRLRNVSGVDLDVDWATPVTVRAGAVLEFAGRPATPADLAGHLGLGEGAEPAYPDDALLLFVDPIEHVLAFPTANWAADVPTKTSKEN
jgi:hypothetical protein